MTTAGFLELLLAGASRPELDAVVADAEAAGATADELEAMVGILQQAIVDVA